MSEDGKIVDTGPARLAQKYTKSGYIVVNITGPLEGKLKDWPPKIQDAIYKCVQDKADKDGHPWEIVMSRCDKDPDTGWFVHVELRAKPVWLQ